LSSTRKDINWAVRWIHAVRPPDQTVTMLAIVICPNAELRTSFENMAHSYPAMRIAKSLDHYPDAEQLKRLMRRWAPKLIFISMEEVNAVVDIGRQLEADFSSVQR